MTRAETRHGSLAKKSAGTFEEKRRKMIQQMPQIHKFKQQLRDSLQHSSVQRESKYRYASNLISSRGVNPLGATP
jgi:hypothetical protein